MKIRFSLLLAALCGFASFVPLHAQTTAFTYQGSLTFDGIPANGSFDLRFIPFNASDGGTQAGPILTNTATVISNGLFTVPLDFSGVNFLGTNYWLEIAVSTNGADGFVTLSPRQPITPVPQAMASVTAVMALRLAGVAENNLVNETEFATVGGGRSNASTGYASIVAGGERNLVNDEFGVVAGGYANTNVGYAAAIGGGELNQVVAEFATVAGGVRNTNTAYAGAIGGGVRNSVSGGYTTVAGGLINIASASYAAVGGGIRNSATNGAASVLGGSRNVAAGYAASVGGGEENQATNDYATVPGGYGNIAAGQFSFAAGRNAHAHRHGSFVWNSYANPAPAFLDNRFHILAPNGFSVDYSAQRPDGGGNRWVVVGPGYPGATVSAWNGASLSDGGVWANASDQQRKTDFQEVDPRAILERVAALPVRQWRYTNEDAAVKHLGPTAQDFEAAFGLGTDTKSIGTVDADGVTLAAIQGLNLKLHDQRAENLELKRELATMKEFLERLRQRLETNTP